MVVVLFLHLKNKLQENKNPGNSNHSENGTESAPCCLISTGSLNLKTYCSFRRMSQLDSATMRITIFFCQEQLSQSFPYIYASIPSSSPFAEHYPIYLVDACALNLSLTLLLITSCSSGLDFYSAILGPELWTGFIRSSWATVPLKPGSEPLLS